MSAASDKVAAEQEILQAAQVVNIEGGGQKDLDADLSKLLKLSKLEGQHWQETAKDYAPSSILFGGQPIIIPSFAQTYPTLYPLSYPALIAVDKYHAQLNPEKASVFLRWLRGQIELRNLALLSTPEAQTLIEQFRGLMDAVEKENLVVMKHSAIGSAPVSSSAAAAKHPARGQARRQSSDSDADAESTPSMGSKEFLNKVEAKYARQKTDDDAFVKSSIKSALTHS